MNTLEATVSRLVTSGAILDVLSPTRQVYLIGELAWLGSNRIFWFTAHGDRIDDGHRLDFGDSKMVSANSVEFSADRKPIARLTAISNAEVDDRDDYAVAFSIWRQIAPDYRRLIDQSREAVVSAAADLPPEASGAEIDVGRTSDDPPTEPANEKSMTDWDIESLLTEVAQGAVAAKTAIALMVLNGIDRNDASRLVVGACDARAAKPS